MFQSDDAAPFERLSTTILDPGFGYKLAAIDSTDLTFEEGFLEFKEFMCFLSIQNLEDIPPKIIPSISETLNVFEI
jgi:hypothetical protein